MEVDLATRVRFTREAFDVERCHTHPHALRYSVGHHSAGVAALVIQTWLEAYNALPRAELIVAALHHDAAELVTGDIPSPMKLLLGPMLDKLESNVEEALRVSSPLTTSEQEWLVAADGLELYLWCLEEVHQRGNTAFASWIAYYHNKWDRQPMPRPFMDLVESANSTFTSAANRLSWEHLRGIAGL